MTARVIWIKIIKTFCLQILKFYCFLLKGRGFIHISSELVNLLNLGGSKHYCVLPQQEPI